MVTEPSEFMEFRSQAEKISASLLQEAGRGTGKRSINQKIRQTRLRQGQQNRPCVDTYYARAGALFYQRDRNISLVR